MPCRTDPADYYSAGSVARLEIDKLTRMLCEVLGIWEGKHGPLSHETYAWWENHKIWDKERKKKERQKNCNHYWLYPPVADAGTRICNLCNLPQKARYE